MDLDQLVEELDDITKNMSSLLREPYERVVNIYKTHHVHTGEYELHTLLRCLKMDKDPRKRLADLLFELELYDNAVEIYKELAEEFETATLWNNYGVTLTKLHQDNDAVNAYHHGLQLNSSSSQLWFNMGKAYYRLKHPKQALKAFTNCTRLDPMNKSAWNNSGVIYRAFGNKDHAVQCYDMATKIDPNYAWAWHNLGVLMLDLKKDDEARGYFQKALNVKPDYAPSRKMLKRMERD